MTRPALEKIWTVIDVVRWASEYFGGKGVDSPRLTIELMLCHVLEMSRLKLYTDFERPLGRDELATLRAMITRRVHHEPLQYILGKADFYGRTLYVNPSVLIPRPETEILVECVVRIARSRALVRGIDIGTGSGCIPIACAGQLPDSTWEAVDISAEACDVARRNVAEQGMQARITVDTLDILAQAPAGTYDMVTINPPYIPVHDVPDLEPEVRDHEPNVALTDGADGMRFYRRMAELLQTGTLLSANGVLAMEVGYDQAADVAALFTGKGWTTGIHRDLQDIPRVVAVQSEIVS